MTPKSFKISKGRIRSIASVLMLLAILALAILNESTTGHYSFDLQTLYDLTIPAGVVGEYLCRSEVWAPHCRSGLVVERRLGKAQVGGSIPPCGSMIWPGILWLFERLRL